MPRRPPFAERGGPVRGVLDLATGRYPAFLFGGPVSGLPVFHLHESDPAVLNSRLRYLAENGYTTVTTDAVVRLVVDRVDPGPRRVALCFDDCWATLWTVAAPLLRSYGMSAIAFAIPARIRDRSGRRPTIEEDPQLAAAADRQSTPFVTWTELRELQASGVIDVQSHTFSHSAIFSDPHLIGFVTPEFVRRPLLERPLVAGIERWLTPEDLGAPLYVQRSRMSDALRFVDDARARERCQQHVAVSGGAGFFDRPAWRTELEALVRPANGASETPVDRRRAIVEELQRGRAVLESQLRSPVRHVCLPWGVAGAETRSALAQTGHQLAFADRLFGRRSVAAGDDPYSLMRLHERFITCLPGRNRRFFFTAV